MEEAPDRGSPLEEEEGKQRSMMASAISYHKYLRNSAAEGSNSLWMEGYTSDDDERDHFQMYDPKNKGHLVFENPYLEVFNVLTTTAGTYPFKTTDNEMKRLSKMSEPLQYTDDPGDSDDDELSDAVKEVSCDIIKRLPINGIPGGVTTTVNVVEEGGEGKEAEHMARGPNGDNLQLPLAMKHHLERVIMSQIEDWRKEGKLQCLSNNQKLMLLEKLKRKTELYLTDQIKSCILNKETM